MLAAGTAVLVWFGLYKFLYRQSFSPGLAGEGVFQYVVWRDPAAAARAKHSSRHRPAENKWSSKVGGLGKPGRGDCCPVQQCTRKPTQKKEAKAFAFHIMSDFPFIKAMSQQQIF